MRPLLPIWLALAASGLPAVAATEPPAEAVTLHLAPAPLDPAARQRMRRWHDEAQDRIQPVLRAWAGLARAINQRPGQPLVAGCRRLDLALAGLDSGDLPAAPDASVSLHLEQALHALRQAAGSCSQGAWFLTSWRLRQAAVSWRELRGRLLLYDFAP